MHHSQLCAVLIDCKTLNIDEAANFWAEGREATTACGKPRQPVDHESRVDIDIERDDIPAEVGRLKNWEPKSWIG